MMVGAAGRCSCCSSATPSTPTSGTSRRVVYDQDRSAASRDLVRRMEATGFYDLVGRGRAATTRSSARCARASARVALVVPPRYARRPRARAAPRTCSSSSTAPIRRPSASAHEHRRVAGRGALRASCCVERARAHGRRAPAPSRIDARARHPVQPRPADRGLRRARARRRHPHDDDGDAHRDGDRARARARHARAAHRLAGAPRRARRRQDPARTSSSATCR